MAMQVTPQCVVALTWTLRDTLGEVLDELKDPVEFLVGGDDLLAKIEEALQGHVAGDTLDLPRWVEDRETARMNPPRTAIRPTDLELEGKPEGVAPDFLRKYRRQRPGDDRLRP